MIVCHRWQNIRGKKWYCHESMRLASKSLTVPIPRERHNVEYRHSHVADILQVVWVINTSHAECGHFSI